jgi:CheY-like chemotaxis protein
MTDSDSSSASAARLPSLLLIDDDPISREVLSMMLEMHGFPVAAAESGVDALAMLEGTPAGVVVMDTQMPGLSGLELIRELRKRKPHRIIAISGSEITRAIREAADGFLLKPVEPEQLVRLLESLDGAKVPKHAAGAPSPGRVAETVIGSQMGSPGESTGQPVIDPAVLGRLRAMMTPKAVREVYEAVASDLKMRLGSLTVAMDSANKPEVARIAHSIKGGSAMVGFAMAAEAAARLEGSNRPETWPKELLQLRCALSALERILSDEFPT